MDNRYLYLAVEAALKAGEAIMTIYDSPTADFEIEKKADNSPLTIADRHSNEVIMGYLKDTPFPVLSEEGKHLDYSVRKEWHSLWVVDPLDGTKEFIKRNGEFTVNIALVCEGCPIMGVIYLPVKKELYFADKGTGAFKLSDITSVNDIRDLNDLISNSSRLPLKQTRNNYVVVASRSHLSEETEKFIADVRQRHQSVELISSGSSIKICLVAEGAADVYPRFAPTMEWDTAAGHAIAKAAGCDIYHVDVDEPLCYNKENLLNPWFIVK